MNIKEYYNRFRKILRPSSIEVKKMNVKGCYDLIPSAEVIKAMEDTSSKEEILIMISQLATWYRVVLIAKDVNEEHDNKVSLGDYLEWAINELTQYLQKN